MKVTSKMSQYRDVTALSCCVKQCPEQTTGLEKRVLPFLLMMHGREWNLRNTE